MLIAYHPIMLSTHYNTIISYFIDLVHNLHTYHNNRYKYYNEGICFILRFQNNLQCIVMRLYPILLPAYHLETPVAALECIPRTREALACARLTPARYLHYNRGLQSYHYYSRGTLESYLS